VVSIHGNKFNAAYAGFNHAVNGVCSSTANANNFDYG
jgi:hypothetical protein